MTIISPDIDERPPPGMHYILLEDVYGKFHADFVTSALGATDVEESYVALYNEIIAGNAFCLGTTVIDFS